MMKQLIALFCCILITGCSSYTTGRYSVSTENIMALRDLKANSVSVGAFSGTKAGQRELTCRGIYPIRTADGEPFSDFIRKAFIDEFRIANAYATTSPLVITGNIDHLDFSSVSGNMEIALTIIMSNGKSIDVNESYSFPTSFFDDANACGQAAQAFIPTVQNIVGKVLKSPEFSSFIAK